MSLISFSGSHSTGKSTLLNRCKEDYSHAFTFVEEITRPLARLGLKVNEDGDNLTQLFVLNSHLEHTLKDNCILDRCILDGLVYTIYLHSKGKVEQWVLDYACKLTDMLMPKYHTIFLLRPEFDIVDDGFRSTNVEFRKEIADLFERQLSFRVGLKNKIVHLSGTVEQRYNIVQERLSKIALYSTGQQLNLFNRDLFKI